MRAKVIIAATLAVVVAASCRGGQVGTQGTASLPAPKPAKASKQLLTQQDKLFNAYVDAVDKYSRRSKANTTKDPTEREIHMSKYLEQRLARFKDMPEYYEVILPFLSLDKPAAKQYLDLAAQAAPDNWNVAYFDLGLPTGILEKRSKDDLDRLVALSRRFPDKAFLHYDAAFVSLELGDEKTAWTELRAGNDATDLSLPTLFPGRYLYERYKAENPPIMPLGGGSVAAINDSMPVFRVGGDMTHFVREWAKATRGEGDPSPTEMHKLVSRFGMMEPMMFLNFFPVLTALRLVDHAAGFDDLSRIGPKIGAKPNGEQSEIGTAVTRYFRKEGELEDSIGTYTLFVVFLQDHFASAPKREGDDSKSGSATKESHRELERGYQYAWEATKGQYFDWVFCEQEIKSKMLEFAAFDYDNPAAFVEKKQATKDKAAK